MFRKISRWFRRPKISSGYVYYAKLDFNGDRYYKIGFTAKPSLFERFAFSGFGDEKHILKQFFFSYDEKAWDIEQTLLEHFNKNRAFGKYSKDPSKPLCGRGQSELFKIDVLGLDKELYILSDTQRKEMATKMQEINSGCAMIIFGIVLAPFTLGLSIFFMILGGSTFFNPNNSVAQTPIKPNLPEDIQLLVEKLSCSSATKNRVLGTAQGAPKAKPGAPFHSNLL